MTPQQFVDTWKKTSLSERSACHSHFLALCELLNQPKPVDADPEGAWYTFERGVNKSDGGHGWADVWKKNHFGWEYKKKRRDLKAAYDQLLMYREDLENPPLLVVCDMDRFEIHTNFTGTIKSVYAFDLDGLADPQNLDILRRLFSDPQSLKPNLTPEAVTQDVANRIGTLADGLKDRGIPADQASHFLMRLIFCMFAEDIGLLGERKLGADGRREDGLFTRLVRSSKSDPAKLTRSLKELFTAMNSGGDFWGEDVLHFNGGLFADSTVIQLEPAEIKTLSDACAPDWENIEPSIFGTLFERILDTDKRSQLGAHYTSRADIETLLEPVVMQPLRREWAAVRDQIDALALKIREQTRKDAKAQKERKADSKERKALKKLIRDFSERLAHVSILDPACGSGNFLYVSLHLLLDLEKEVITYAARQGIGQFPQIRPTQLAGIEINPYAQELASVVIWIGYLQWMHHNGFNPPSNPVLEPIESIRRMDAILDLSDPAHPCEPEWPDAEFIVGNPPFLGNKKLRAHLGDEYVNALFARYQDRIPNGSDFCCYWFERGREQLVRQRASRIGLLATQSIRGGHNRETLHRIKESCDIFFAESDRDWVLDGANVHVSMVGFDDGSEKLRVLDGQAVEQINANLSAASDTTTARRIRENSGIAYIGTTKKAPFDICDSIAEDLLRSVNPTGRPTSDVVFPYANGMTVTRRDSRVWIIDFHERAIAESASFESAFEYVREHVRPVRENHREPRQQEKWWLLARSCPEMQAAISRLPRFLVTPTVCKYRVFAWMYSPTEPDHQLYVFARSDDYFFGVLHSRPHELWGLKLGTRLETRPRYTPTTCFETFPFPVPTDSQREEISAAAQELDQLRCNWLNPAEWTKTEYLEFPGTVGGPWDRYIVRATDGAPSPPTPLPGGEGSKRIGTVRYPRVVPKDDASAAQLKKRTLTNLYNERPTWLDLAHKKLDAAVFAAYGWDAGMSDDALLAALLKLNLERAGK